MQENFLSDEEGGSEARLTPCAIYENQRWQPIRGWGSSYPGHLLPTDRCRYNLGDGRRGAMRWSDIAPGREEASRSFALSSRTLANQHQGQAMSVQMSRRIMLGDPQRRRRRTSCRTNTMTRACSCLEKCALLRRPLRAFPHQSVRAHPTLPPNVRTNAPFAGAREAQGPCLQFCRGGLVEPQGGRFARKGPLA